MKQATIINESAGSKHKKINLDMLVDNENSEIGKIFYTNSPNDATNIAKKLLEEKYEKIKVVGGDGTINEVMQPLINSSCVLELIPKGTGNDFIKSLDDKINLVDAGKCNNRYFINSMSVGFDANATKATQDKFKNKSYIPSSMAYMLGIVYMLFRYKGIKLDVEIDGVSLEKNEFLMIVVANGSYYGHGIEIAPLAKIDDGYLDVCVIDKVSRFKLLYLLIILLLKKTHWAKEYKVYKAERVKITTSEDTYIQMDGELEHGKNFDINIVKKAIKVIKKNIKY